MDDITKLKTAFHLIVAGLYEKERHKIKGEYYYSKKLNHGINIFQFLNYTYNPRGFDFNKMHEQSFITNYAMYPVARWFDEWEKKDELNLMDQDFYNLGALVGDSGFNTFHLTDDCEDYIEYIEKDLVGDIEQRAVYNCLKALNQDEYVDLRKYFIDHPITNLEELRKLKLKYSWNDIALRAIENAYEEIMEDCFICPNCGWTLQKEKIGMRCQNRSCTEVKYIQGELKIIKGDTGMLRLKRGVMKYIASPGKLELEIYTYCNKHKVRAALWPEMDKYDVSITFSDDVVWAIDAKAIREPQFLKETIIRNGGFPDGDYKRGLYIIPDAYAADRTDYVDIINHQLNSMGNGNICCERLRDLKKEIRERSARDERNKEEV